MARHCAEPGRRHRREARRVFLSLLLGAGAGQLLLQDGRVCAAKREACSHLACQLYYLCYSAAIASQRAAQARSARDEHRLLRSAEPEEVAKLRRRAGIHYVDSLCPAPATLPAGLPCFLLASRCSLARARRGVYVRGRGA